MGRTRNPFRGLVDTMSEMARMREYAEGGGGQDRPDAPGPEDDAAGAEDEVVQRDHGDGVEGAGADEQQQKHGEHLQVERSSEGQEAWVEVVVERVRGLYEGRIGWQRGTHPELGAVTLGQLLSTWVVHDLSHVGQIVRVMARQYSEAVGAWRAYLPVLNRS